MRRTRRPANASAASLGCDMLTAAQTKAIAAKVEAEMSTISIVARSASVAALDRANNHLVGMVSSCSSAPVLSVKKHDRHKLREASGAQLWSGKKDAALMTTNSVNAIQQPHTALHRQAQRAWRAAPLPRPIAAAADRFDAKLISTRKRAHVAFDKVKEDPTSQQHAQKFGTMVRELSRERFSLVAPVEHLTEAYPDGVWGITLDRLGCSKGYDRPRSARSGVQFPSRPESNKVPVRQVLPTMPGMRKGEIHMMLPDSHHALGAFPAVIADNWRRTASPVASPVAVQATMPEVLPSQKPPRQRLTKERVGAPRPGGTGGGWEMLESQLKQLKGVSVPGSESSMKKGSLAES